MASIRLQKYDNNIFLYLKKYLYFCLLFVEKYKYL